MKHIKKYKQFESFNVEDIEDILSELELEGYDVVKEKDINLNFDLISNYDESKTLVFTISKKNQSNIPRGSWMYIFKLSDISDTLNRLIDFINGRYKLEIIYDNRLSKVELLDYIENIEVYGALNLSDEKSHRFSIVISEFRLNHKLNKEISN